MTRVPLWDNARFAAVVLVVIGHAIQPQTHDSDNALSLYLFIYSFHMPALMMLSGYLSRAEPLDARRTRALVTDLVIPYLLFQAIWSLVQFLVEGEQSFNPTTPHWTLWFLIALAIFRAALPYLAQLRWPLLWAVIGAVTVGYLTNIGSTFALARTFGILPFFVLGWMLRDARLVTRWLEAGRITWAVRAAAVAVLGGWFAIVVANVGAFREADLAGWLQYDDAYRDLDAPQWWSGLVRLGLMALAVLLTAAFVALVPRRGLVVTAAGRATLYVYLLHSFVLYPIRQSGILRDEHSSASWVALMVALSVVIALVLASPPVQRLFRPLVQPRARWLFRREPELTPR